MPSDQQAFVVTLSISSPDIAPDEIAQAIEEELTHAGFDVASVNPWDHKQEQQNMLQALDHAQAL